MHVWGEFPGVIVRGVIVRVVIVLVYVPLGNISMCFTEPPAGTSYSRRGTWWRLG